MSDPTPYTPMPGELVHDHRTNRTGVLMDTIAGKLYLRPPGGGIEWTAHPTHIGRPMSPPGSVERPSAS
ncbi:hypothetical protein [Kitasatospora sp. NPDC093806]|uniref:hypothetical protein n=1 Tax=Kitasatospora sp. NPDC093806 TaxID=3155075 RepID=UPI0034473AA4